MTRDGTARSAGPTGLVDDVAHALFAPDAAHGVSLALVVQHRGHVVFERYGAQPDTLFGPGGPVGPDTTLISWSMAKSMTQAAVGIAVGDGLLDVSAPAPVESWRGTEKESITLDQLLEMRSGLEFVEDYVDQSISHCIDMLYGAGQDDMATYAAALPLVHPPGTVWNYSSGTTNIIARIVGQAVGGGEDGMARFLHERLFGPAGMTTAQPKFDPAGTFVGSSYVFATARDFARFGQLYLDDGMVGERRVLPQGWRDHARAPVSFDDEGGFGYGRQWWLWPQFEGSLACHGYEGQYTIVAPDRDLVVVHLGKSPAETREPLVRALTTVVDAFAP
jgi:CubicO group peptidase (beta-lactamase class C family)